MLFESMLDKRTTKIFASLLNLSLILQQVIETLTNECRDDAR